MKFKDLIENKTVNEEVNQLSGNIKQLKGLINDLEYINKQKIGSGLGTDKLLEIQSKIVDALENIETLNEIKDTLNYMRYNIKNILKRPEAGSPVYGSRGL